MKTTNNEKPWYERMTEAEAAAEKKRDCKTCVVTMIVGAIIFFILMFFTSCATPDQPITKPTVLKTEVNRIPESATGTYKSIYGEPNTGTVIIYSDRVIIHTLQLSIDTTAFIYETDCWFIINLPNGKRLRIMIFSNGTLTLSILEPGQTEIYYGDPAFRGNFKKQVLN